MTTLALIIAAGLLAVGLAQSVRTRACRIDRTPQPRKIAVWLGAGIALTVAASPPLLLAPVVLILALIASSLIVTVATRALHRLGV